MHIRAASICFTRWILIGQIGISLAYGVLTVYILRTCLAAVVSFWSLFPVRDFVYVRLSVTTMSLLNNLLLELVAQNNNHVFSSGAYSGVT